MQEGTYEAATLLLWRQIYDTLKGYAKASPTAGKSRTPNNKPRIGSSRQPRRRASSKRHHRRHPPDSPPVMQPTELSSFPVGGGNVQSPGREDVLCRHHDDGSSDSASGHVECESNGEQPDSAASGPWFTTDPKGRRRPRADSCATDDACSIFSACSASTNPQTGDGQHRQHTRRKPRLVRLAVELPAPVTWANAPLRRQRKSIPCWHFNTVQGCHFGDRCHFKHVRTGTGGD